MIKRTALLLALGLALVAPPAAPAAAPGFGIEPGSVSTVALNKNGTIDERASSHPYSWALSFRLNTNAEERTEGGEMRDAIVNLPPGMVGNALAVPRCTREDFEGFSPNCPVDTQIGILRANLPGGYGLVGGPVYNLVPPPGVAAQLGFAAGGLNALQNATAGPEHEYGVRVAANNIPEETTEVIETIWGVPADPGHDKERGKAAGTHGENSPSTAPLLPYLTLPANCDAPLKTTVSVDSKLAPGVFDTAAAYSRAPSGSAAALGGCEGVPFKPQIASQMTSKLAESASGLSFQLKLPNEGLLNPGGIAETEPRKIEVALPDGVTANPSAAEGLGVCTEAQYEAEQTDSGPGEGCPEASKLGSIVAHTPLLEEPIEGSLYLAKPYENPEGTLIALYLVFRAPERAVLVKQSGRVVPDPSTGRLVTTLEGLPPLPYSDATLHFREGARGLLVTPDGCGSYATTARLYPFSDPGSPVTKTAYFQIERGVDGGGCPAGEPFNPGFEAGTKNNQAGSYSPFYMRLTRRDGDQDLTKFSSKLPPGVVGRLAGTAQCSDAAIAAARSRTGPNGGHEELDHPSCPADSEIGKTVAGAGVGGVLTYVPGHLYLAGPYNGAPLSVVAITPGVAGPFDVGTIVVRQALRINPLTVEVEADGGSSDPIPHILKGIPLKVREVRVYVDKPDFTLQPDLV